MHRDQRLFPLAALPSPSLCGRDLWGGEGGAALLLVSAAPQAGSGRGAPRAAMAAAFSSDGEAALRRELSAAAAAPAPRGGLDGYYEIDRAAAFVRDGGFRRVSAAERGAAPCRGAAQHCWRWKGSLGIIQSKPLARHGHRSNAPT